MPHHHDHDCAHEHDHDHDDHDSLSTGAQDNLYQYIDRANVMALNADDNCKGSDAIKPWHERTSEDKVISFVESEADDQLIIRIPFTGSVKLRSVLLKTGPADLTPLKVVLFANEDNLDFQDVADRKPTQEFDIAQGREVGEYAVKTAKFPNVSSLTLFFPSSQGAETVRIYYIGLLGTWTERKSNPVITVYEAQANLADHQKIQGTEGNFSAFQS
ncbi:galactose-binding domain-like protein [Lentinula detonsa]|uniref:Galactose-binding domain-like protein n=1 Tax=Lentinula detonsa TaxID=2804962 RepID=A0A9W8P041_9AGAR|nr:galactose-binding domain-like protein [Lentinula detonsa]